MCLEIWIKDVSQIYVSGNLDVRCVMKLGLQMCLEIGIGDVSGN